MKKRIMTTKIKIAFTLNSIMILAGYTFGFRYLFSPELLQYHLDAMNIATWADVLPAQTYMLLIFMKVAGLGMTTSSVAMSLILFFGFRKNENWSRWAILIICLVHYCPLMINMYHLVANTTSNPPYLVNFIGISLAIIAFFLSSGMKKNESVMQ